MHFTLARLLECNPQEHFFLAIPNWFLVQSVIFSALNPGESFRVSRTCIALYIDQKELFLWATAVRINYCASTFSVVTPPLQPFLRLQLAHGQGGVWDQSSGEVSQRSIPNSSDHALEGQYTD